MDIKHEGEKGFIIPYMQMFTFGRKKCSRCNKCKVKFRVICMDLIYNAKTRCMSYIMNPHYPLLTRWILYLDLVHNEHDPKKACLMEVLYSSFTDLIFLVRNGYTFCLNLSRHWCDPFPPLIFLYILCDVLLDLCSCYKQCVALLYKNTQNSLQCKPCRCAP